MCCGSLSAGAATAVLLATDSSATLRSSSADPSLGALPVAASIWAAARVKTIYGSTPAALASLSVLWLSHLFPHLDLLSSDFLFLDLLSSSLLFSDSSHLFSYHLISTFHLSISVGSLTSKILPTISSGAVQNRLYQCDACTFRAARITLRRNIV